jgi:hypothetical protein
MEDDDWYYNNYIEETLDRLRNVLISGEINTIYYNIQHRCYKQLNNDKRSSLCQTAFRGELLPKVKKYISNVKSAFLDSRLWTHVMKSNIPYLLTADKRLCVGMKGMPGRLGIGIGHRPKYGFKLDTKFDVLKKLMGAEDSDWYIKLCQH